ncbi:hypothetical protein LZ32DRAFT_100989 [Colletotrichum eremochloae]|nr:hypothetical protein LZ32DRAFT_100989 [Colletotrichum eremochloae]
MGVGISCPSAISHVSISSQSTLLLAGHLHGIPFDLPGQDRVDRWRVLACLWWSRSPGTGFLGVSLYFASLASWIMDETGN